MSGRDSSGLSSTRTSSASRTHPCICSMARTSDDCETSKSTWASGPRTIDSEAPGEMRWKWRLGLLAIAGLEVPLLLWTSTAMGASPEILLYAGGILALVLMAMLLVRPLFFTFLVVWLGGLMGSAWYLVRFLPPTPALGLGATLSTVRSAAGGPVPVAAVSPAPRIAAHMIENASCETFRGSSAATIPPSRLTTATASAFVTSRSARTMSATAVTLRPPVRRRIHDRPYSRTPLPRGARGVSSSLQGASRESREAGGTSPRRPRALPQSSRAPLRPNP